MSAPGDGGPAGRDQPQRVGDADVSRQVARRQRRAEARLTDGEIVERLREANFDPNCPLGKRLARDLAEYGASVLMGWAMTGELGVRVAERGGLSSGRVPRTLRFEVDEAQEFIGEVLAVALRNFYSKSMQRWAPDGGACLRTYFVGRCLMEVGGVYRRWEREQRDRHEELPLVDDGRFAAQPDEGLEARELVDEVLDRDPVVRRILELQDQGYDGAEIAKKLAIPPSAVKSRPHRLRKRLSEGELDA